MSTTIYKLCSVNNLNLSIELVLPTLNDIKVLVLENEKILDLLLQNRLKVEKEVVSTRSKKYHTALKNSKILG